MKDILKIMRFDFLTAKPLSIGPALIVIVICFALSLFFSPVICSYITFGAVLFVIPLQSVADKSEFHKLYGTLPVNRKNITRARFIYVFAVCFIAEIIEFVLAFIAFQLKLYRIIPNQSGAMMQIIHNGFDDPKLMLFMIVAMFSFICLAFAYMEMMGQIFGRENEMKIILITLGALSALAIGFLMLSDHDIIPTLKLPNLPATISGRVITGVIINIVLFGFCLLVGEITARKLAKREL